MNEDLDFEIDDIIEEAETKQKRKKKSGKKGKRVELELVKRLNERFADLLEKHPDWGQFSRSVGSGNRWGQRVHLSKAATDTYAGDITCPTNFLFSLESKGGYNEIDVFTAFDGGHRELDAFLEQAEHDGTRTNRKPMLIWKKDRKLRLAFIKKHELEQPNTEYFMFYRDWLALDFENLMALGDEFFFELP